MSAANSSSADVLRNLSKQLKFYFVSHFLLILLFMLQRTQSMNGIFHTFPRIYGTKLLWL